MSILGLIFLFSLPAQIAVAQTLRPREYKALRDSINVAATPTLVTKAPLLGGATISGMLAPIRAGGKDLLLQQYTAEIGGPVYGKAGIRRPYFGKLSLRYQGMSLSGTCSSAYAPLHSVQAMLSHTCLLDSETHLTVLAAASAASDFRAGIGTDDLILIGGFRIGWHQRSNFRYGLTVMYVNTYLGHILLPMPDFYWKIDHNWNLSGFIPVRVSLKYGLAKAQTAGITVGQNSGSYRFNGYTSNEQFVTWSQYSGGLIYDATVNRRWKFNLIAGYAFSQRMQVLDNDQKLGLNQFGRLMRQNAAGHKSNGVVIQSGISFLF